MANINNEYDIVIVGGGAAGLVLANRLSEDPTLQILILEAGINRNTDPKISIPGNVTQPFGDPNYDWKFESVPQAGLDGKVIAQTQGKGRFSCIRDTILSYRPAANFCQQFLGDQVRSMACRSCTLKAHFMIIGPSWATRDGIAKQ